MVDLAPWGAPPTPLLPRWYREELAGTPLPGAVRRANPTLETVGELGTFWEKVQAPVGKDVLDALVSLIQRWPPPDHVVIHAGFDPKEILAFPLRKRTANVLHSLHENGQLSVDEDITVGILMSAWSFGRRSLLDLMCVAELASPESRESPPEADTPGVSCPPTSPRPEGEQLLRLLDVLLSAAREFHGAETVGQALRLDLYGLASTIGMAEELDSRQVRDFTRCGRISDTVTQRLADFPKSLSPREALIVEWRLFSRSPARLEDLGRVIGVTRERVRQIEQALLEKVEKLVGREVGILARFLGEQIGPVVDAAVLDDRIAALFAPSDEGPSIGHAIGLVRTKLNYSCVNGICLDEAALGVTKAMKEAIASGGDEVGLVDAQTLRDQLPGEDWSGRFCMIIQACDFAHYGNWIAPRDTVPARAKAALLRFGRPATAEEIAEASGLDVHQVRGQFRRLPTVVKADKMHWGLCEWIDDEYEGIAAEIIQRINEDGGATPLARLIEELPERFGVSQSSVEIIAATRQFSVQDGHVSMANEGAIELRDLDDVIHGRTAAGEPYWIFRVEARYLEGHSLARFPAELASELGCEPNGKIRVRVHYPPDCRDLAVSWRLSSPTDASLGYLSDPLQQFGFATGDRVRLILRRSGGVELHPESQTD